MKSAIEIGTMKDIILACLRSKSLIRKDIFEKKDWKTWRPTEYRLTSSAILLQINASLTATKKHRIEEMLWYLQLLRELWNTILLLAYSARPYFRQTCAKKKRYAKTWRTNLASFQRIRSGSSISTGEWVRIVARSPFSKPVNDNFFLLLKLRY